jgi:hypothetical protein
MPLPPIKISDEVQKQAYEDLAKGSMRQFGDALAVLVGRVLSPRLKSPEELALDWHHGAEESENRRRLAAEALDRIPFARRMLPAPQIVGRVFRDSEFEMPGTPIWDMWSQLLSRACDSDRVHEAHPSFSWIISQLSPDEARILQAFALLEPQPLAGATVFPTIRSADIGIAYPNLMNLYLGHIGSLGLQVLPMGFEPTEHVVYLDQQRTYMLTSFGQSFVGAVSEPPEK